MPHLTYDRYDAELQAETARFAAAVRDADPAHPVPTCPAWTLAQLTEHVGFGHRWAAVIVERRPPSPSPTTKPTTSGSPRPPTSGPGGCWPAPADSPTPFARPDRTPTCGPGSTTRPPSPASTTSP